MTLPKVTRAGLFFLHVDGLTCVVVQSVVLTFVFRCLFTMGCLQWFVSMVCFNGLFRAVVCVPF